MQTVERQSLESKLEKIGNVLHLTGWIGLSAQVGLGAISLLMVAFAIAGRSFSQAALPPGVTSGIGANLNRGVTPGIGIGIFWAVCGILALLVGIYFAFRQVRFAKRLRHADTVKHPAKSEVM